MEAPRQLGGHAQFLARLEREAKAIASLDHPHICTLHDGGHDSGTRYLVIEMIEGESLADRIAEGRLPIDQLLRLGGQIASAFEAAHRKGIVH